MPRLFPPRMAFAGTILVLVAPLVFSASRPLPEDVTVKAFATRQQGHLELLVRVPLAVLRDIQVPTRGDAGYLDLAAAKSMLPGAARYWIANCFDVYENGSLLGKPAVTAARISAGPDQSFNSYQDASAILQGPDLPADTNTFWDQAWLDIRFEYPLASDRSHILILPKVAALGVRVSSDFKYVEPNGTIREFSFAGDPGAFYLNPTWGDAAWQFLRHGSMFVLTGADLLLFLLCLALPFRHYRDLLPALIAFGGAITIGLLASTFGLAIDAIWFRPLIETLSAVAVLAAAFANIMGHVTPGRRALFALCAGFIFGFACSFDLAAKLQYGGSHSFTSAIGFDLGVLLAIAAVGALLVPSLSFLFSFARTQNIERIIVTALAADTAWGWLDERWARLSKIPMQLVFEAGALAVTLRVLAVLVLVGGLLWFANEWLKSSKVVDADSSARQKGRTAI